MFSIESGDKKGSILNGITDHVLNSLNFETKLKVVQETCNLKYPSIEDFNALS